MSNDLFYKVYRLSFPDKAMMIWSKLVNKLYKLTYKVSVAEI